jgi:hypothetical protein
MLALPSFSKNSSGDGNPLLDYGMFCLFGLDKNKARSAGVPSLSAEARHEELTCFMFEACH